MTTIEAGSVVTSKGDTELSLGKGTHGFRGADNILLLELRGRYTDVGVYNNSTIYIFMFYAFLNVFCILQFFLNV